MNADQPGSAGRNPAGAPPPAEVIALAARAVAGTDRGGRLVARDRLKRRVHRLHFEADGAIGTAIVKRLWAPRAGRAVELALGRWLPDVGLGWACPRLLGTLGDPADGEVWHVYEDVGGIAVDPRDPDPAQLEPIVDLLADLHGRFAGHRLLAECRAHGEDLGPGFFTSQVASCIDALRSIPVSVAEQRDARERLLDRVERLHGERHRRLAVAAACAGPDTLLHGDLWTENTLLVHTARGPVPRLIDWDHVGVGPVAYDLSTFLYRFPAASRPSILGAYREAAARRGRQLASDGELNLLFDTAEQARYACCLTTPARAAARGERWALPHLAEIDGWFVRLEPVLHETEMA